MAEIKGGRTPEVISELGITSKPIYRLQCGLRQTVNKLPPLDNVNSYGSNITVTVTFTFNPAQCVRGVFHLPSHSLQIFSFHRLNTFCAMACRSIGALLRALLPYIANYQQRALSRCPSSSSSSSSSACSCNSCKPKKKKPTKCSSICSCAPPKSRCPSTCSCKPKKKKPTCCPPPPPQCVVPKKACVFIPAGFDELEAMTATAILRRGKVAVTLAGLHSDDLRNGEWKTCVKPDDCLANVCCEQFDAIVLPGGRDAVAAMILCQGVGTMLCEQAKACRIIAAICAAPLVLQKHCIAHGKQLTAHPCACSKLARDYCVKPCDVVVDDWLITSQGCAHSLKFALTVLMHLVGEQAAYKVAKKILLPK